MVNVNTLVQSKFLKAADLEGRQHLSTIIAWHIETMDDKNGKKQKIALTLREWDRDLLLNTTNVNNIAAFLGSETDNWVGQQIVLFSAYVDFQGKTVEAIRIRAPRMAPATQPARTVPPVQPQQQSAPPPGHPASFARDLDDEVPF